MKKEDIREVTSSGPVEYTIKEVAAILGAHPNTVANKIRERKITASKLVGTWKITQEALDAYIASCTVKATI